MTPKQTALYWREWSKAKKALERGLQPASTRDWDQIRYELHHSALGRDKSSKDFTNKDLDRVLAAFRALSDPANLNAQLAQQSQPRKRMLWFIESCNPGYVATLMRERFNALDPSDLTDEQLHQLTVTLKNRPKAKAQERGLQPASPHESAIDYRLSQQPEFAASSDPF